LDGTQLEIQAVATAATAAATVAATVAETAAATAATAKAALWWPSLQLMLQNVAQQHGDHHDHPKASP